MSNQPSLTGLNEVPNLIGDSSSFKGSVSLETNLKLSAYITNVSLVFLKHTNMVIMRYRNLLYRERNIYISFNCVVLQFLDTVEVFL
jgi:hypothetical protein